LDEVSESRKWTRLLGVSLVVSGVANVVWGVAMVVGALSEENTKAFKARWGKFLDEIEDAFLKSLAKMASALVQENVFAA